MPTLAAWQQIYANVEKEQSPQGRGGFQTLLHTRAGLTEAEVEEIEGHLLYFPSEGEPVKRVFFTTSAGKAVLAQVVHLPEADRAGRGGRYLGHALAFAPEARAAVAGHLFGLFARVPFATTVEDALGRGDRATGDIAPADVALPDDAQARQVEEAQRWPPEELRRLAMLALRAPALKQERRSVALVGSPDEALQALAAAFLALPGAAAAQCSFDTYFHGCNPVAVYYWAVGLASSSGSQRFIEVDARARRVLGQVPEAVQTSYERWAVATLASGRLAALAQHKGLAFELGEWLDMRLPAPPPIAPGEQEAALAVLRANEAQTKALLRGRLQQWLPPHLAAHVFPRVYAQGASPELLERLRRGFALRGLLDELYAAYATEQFRMPGREEVDELREVLKREGHRSLWFILACWRGDTEHVRRELAAMNEADYSTFLAVALRYRAEEPLALMVPRRAGAFIEVYCRVVPSGDVDLVALTDAVLWMREGAALARAAAYVSPRRPAKELRKLASLVREAAREVPAIFSRAVDDALAAQPPQKSLTGSIKRLFGLGPDEDDRPKPGRGGPWTGPTSGGSWGGGGGRGPGPWRPNPGSPPKPGTDRGK